MKHRSPCAVLVVAAVICGAASRRLAWMAVTLHARVPILGCRGKKCKSWYTSPVASFLDARTGKLIEALTINGWKPQLPPG